MQPAKCKIAVKTNASIRETLLSMLSVIDFPFILLKFLAKLQVSGMAKAYFTSLFQYSITDTPISVRSRIKVTSSHPSSPMLFITSEVDVVPPAECFIKWIVSLYSHCCMRQPYRFHYELPLQVCAGALVSVVSYAI